VKTNLFIIISHFVPATTTILDFRFNQKLNTC